MARRGPSAAMDTGPHVNASRIRGRCSAVQGGCKGWSEVCVAFPHPPASRRWSRPLSRLPNRPASGTVADVGGLRGGSDDGRYSGCRLRAPVTAFTLEQPILLTYRGNPAFPRNPESRYREIGRGQSVAAVPPTADPTSVAGCSSGGMVVAECSLMTSSSVTRHATRCRYPHRPRRMPAERRGRIPCRRDQAAVSVLPPTDAVPYLPLISARREPRPVSHALSSALRYE